MANQTLIDALSLVGVKNLQYERNQDRWNFLLESYVGGETYRRGGHLVRYTLETDAEYAQRLRSTPLDNHCKSVISTYVSFLFREEPDRELDSIMTDEVESFLRDADMDGRSLDAFMKEASIWSSVFGHCWILMTKPSVMAETLADQLAQGVRPYVNLLTPLVVTDWDWQRLPNGRYDLTYFKYIEDVNDTVTTIREWTKDFIRTYEYNDRSRTAELIYEEINELGEIPAVLVYNQRSQVRGIGISDIDDIADMQRAIYNELSEVEQSVRLEGHPSLVVTPDVQLGAGAGALIQMPDGLDPGLKPYVLSVDPVPINSIYESIKNRVAAIDKMANTGGIRATETRTMSGVAMETEFQLLNAKLSEKADNLELAEEQIWQLWCRYQGQQWMGSIEYPGSFNIRDSEREFDELLRAKQAATSTAVLAVVDYKIMEALDEEPDEIMSALQAFLPAVPNIEAVTQTAELIEAPDPGEYPDGEDIDPRLPDAYQLATNPDVPPGQNCANCGAYQNGLCSVWGGAQVRPGYWCARWIPIQGQ